MIPETLLRTKVVAILRGGEQASVARACRVLIDSGLRCLEITTNTGGVWEVLAALRAEYGSDVELGVGTVRGPEHVDAAQRAGASFVVSPDVNALVGERAAQRGLGWYPGALTPTEITGAWAAGASAVKVFPVSTAGGPEYLRQVRAPLDDIPLLPTGGIGIDAVAEYLRAGAIAVGMGGPLIGDALSTGDTGPLAERAKRLLRAVGAE